MLDATAFIYHEKKIKRKKRKAFLHLKIRKNTLPSDLASYTCIDLSKCFLLTANILLEMIYKAYPLSYFFLNKSQSIQRELMN